MCVLIVGCFSHCFVFAAADKSMLSNNLNVKDWSYDLSRCSGWQTYFERLFVLKIILPAGGVKVG